MSEPIVPFGKQFREKYFRNLDPLLKNVNHGAMGLTPDIIQQKYIEYFTEQNKFPEKYIRFDERDEYINSLKLLSSKEMLNCDYRNLAIVDNATTGVNVILRSHPFKKDDKIVLTSTTYQACSNTVKYLQNKIGIVPIVIDLDYPLNNSEIVSKFEQTFRDESPIKLCLFDTVSSLPGIRLPFEEINLLCKKFNILSLIDGAHGIGLISLSLGNLKPDFFVTNLHKWFFVPRGCAVVYVDSKFHRLVHSIPISHSYLDDQIDLETEELEKMRLVNCFQFVGTSNRANISTIKDAINFRNKICGGEISIRKYCNALCYKVGEIITKEIWPGMAYLDNDDNSTITSMINIEVPFDKYITSDFDKKDLSKTLLYLEKRICFKYNTFVPFFMNNNKVWIRFSCQIYNEIDDYVFAAKAIDYELDEFFSNKIYNKFKDMKKSGAVFLAFEE